ncbi:MAG: deoxyguanosinetriphosphate triphosphohydrolase [Candidatus Omnitrophica bacterium]|nr:deoxyguanosinetriphosphate triphosphohydrolase [Candidatus Omnitrophota bacterium]
MRTRKDIEFFEEKSLAPYAMKSKDSAGREFYEPPHDTRTCYQRDRDRIVHCEAFRKLEYKTQVFGIFEGDYYRTRLTHTIEVAQIARTIGRSLCLNEDLIEAIALAHDLGHPPFGHAGEGALNAIMQKHKVGSFNHNLHSYEIVTEQEKKYPDFVGLNLTDEVLIGILKHETDYDKGKSISKYKNKGPTLEARAVDIADALAYLSHDIDDGLTSGCITPEDLNPSALWQKASERVPQGLDKEMFKYQIVRALIDIQVKDLLAQSEKNLKQHHFRSSQEIKDYHLKHKDAFLIGFSLEMKNERDKLQKLLHKKFYEHYRVVRMTDKARRIINDLFAVYAETPKQLPYTVYPRDRKYTKKIKYEVICNYIASMTDRFALDEHKKLFEPYQKV